MRSVIRDWIHVTLGWTRGVIPGRGRAVVPGWTRALTLAGARTWAPVPVAA
jgi:hypothetical protein